VKVLVIGGGGREHAIIWKLSQSKHINKIYCCPGNAGIAEIAECIDLSPYDFNTLIDFVKYEWIDLTIIGSEKIFSSDIVNAFEKEGCRILGPGDIAAKASSSRVFAKDLLQLHRIPTAEYKVFTSYIHAQDYIRLKGAPIVIKTDGCPGYKGAFVAYTVEQALDIIKLILKDRVFGDAGRQVIIEEHFKGERLSYVAATDGEVILPLTTLCIYRSTLDSSAVSNTVNLGAYSPVLNMNKELEVIIMEKITKPVLKALNSERSKYRGFISADLIIDNGKVLLDELNCSFEDLAAETILPRLSNDLTEVIMAMLEQRLSGIQIDWKYGASVCITLHSSISSGINRKGVILNGLERIKPVQDVMIFHENTSFNNNDIITSGGRAISITATGADIKEAQSRVYSVLETIHFNGMNYMPDIGTMD
jgi:phosphoribosylamine---glycine ligase